MACTLLIVIFHTEMRMAGSFCRVHSSSSLRGVFRAHAVCIQQLRRVIIEIRELDFL